MATIHLTEISRILTERGDKDASLYDATGGFFLEIRFDKPGSSTDIVDEEYVNKALPVVCPYGQVLILFDETGQLKSIEIC